MAKEAAEDEGEWPREPIDTFEEGAYKSDIALVKTPKGSEALQITTSRKVTSTYTKVHRGLWMPKGLFGKWIAWLNGAMIKIATKWGISVEPKKEVEYYKNLAEEFQAKYDDARKKTQEAEARAVLKEEELLLAMQVVDKLAEYGKAYDELVEEVKKQKQSGKRDEKKIKDMLYENRWMLGLDCVVKAREKPIDTQASIDMHIQTELGQDKIYEFKSPALLPFKKRKTDSRLEVDQEFSEGVNQVIQYLQKTDYRATQATPGGYGIAKAIGTIIIGYDLDGEQANLLKEWQFHLRPHVDVKTYNDLIDSAKRQLENIKFAREAGKREAEKVAKKEAKTESGKS